MVAAERFEEGSNMLCMRVDVAALLENPLRQGQGTPTTSIHPDTTLYP